MNPGKNPQDFWKEDDPALPQPGATAEICARARRREREHIWQRRIGLFALAGLALAFAHNIVAVRQPWVRLGQGWMLIIMGVYLWTLLRNRTERRPSNETCARFLIRALEAKRNGFVAVRRLVLLTIPAMLCSWWGGGPALHARAMGMAASSVYYRYLTSVWPMVATSVLLLLVWFAFNYAAAKTSAELETLRRKISAQ
jgi:hypothetical protein